MQYINLVTGKTARIALGCDHYGEVISEDTAFRLLDIYREHGGNLLDTARLYGQKTDGGYATSEVVVGRWLKENGRDGMIIATKGGHPHIGDMTKSRLDEKSLESDIMQSMDALGCTPDIYFLHRDDARLPVDGIMETLASFVEKGWTRFIGASNWSVERIAEANRYAEKHSLPGFSFSELQFSLAVTDRETWGDNTIEIMESTSPLSWYKESRMPFLAFSSQAKGIFSKVIAGKEDEISERAKKRFLSPENRARIERVRKISERIGANPAHIAISYVTSQNANGIAIAGASRESQLRDTLSGADLVLSEDILTYLDGSKTC